MDSLATMTSLSLQYGVPLHDLVNKFSHMRFEPAGFTGNSEIPIAKSIVDYGSAAMLSVAAVMIAAIQRPTRPIGSAVMMNVGKT